MPSTIYQTDTITQAEARDFWRNVDLPEDENGCWEWNVPRKRKRKMKRGGRRSPSPRITWQGRCMQAHRVAWTLRHGEVPDDLKVRRLCGNLRCCNPAHMDLGKGGKPCQLTAKEQREAMHLWRTSNLPITAIAERLDTTWDVINELVKRELM